MVQNKPRDCRKQDPVLSAPVDGVCCCRAPACNVVLEHLSISRQHVQLTVDLSGTVLLMDLGSQHGTKLNDAWIKPQQQRTMSVGSVVQFGASTRRYKLLEVQKF
jgi:dual specificity MAP kinase phosphatase